MDENNIRDYLATVQYSTEKHLLWHFCGTLFD